MYKSITSRSCFLLFVRILIGFFSTPILSWGEDIKTLTTNVQYVDVVTVIPGENLQELINDSPPGTTFLIQPGVHRSQAIRPKHGDSIVGTSGAILSGAQVIHNFKQHGKYWVAEVRIPHIPHKGKCEKQSDGEIFNGCTFANDLFIDDQPLMQVTDLLQIDSQKWFFDALQHKVYISENPFGKTVELSTVRYAIFGRSNNITIRNLIIEKYANPAQEGAIHPMNAEVGALGKNWVIDRNEIRLNHGMGIRLGHHMLVTENHIHQNGQLGIGGAGNDILIMNNEISFNNIQRFDSYWEAGGTKFSRTTNLIVKDNFVHHNNGPGLWTDGNNIHTIYDGNRVLKNAGPGIFHEISYDAVIKNNFVEGNGFKFKKWTEGAGILVAGSPNVEVVGNTVKDNRHGICGIQTERGGGKYGPYETENLYVHDNSITMETGETGLSVQSRDLTYFTSRKNRFQNNGYILMGKKKKYFRWKNAIIPETQWIKFGQDIEGTFSYID